MVPSIDDRAGPAPGDALVVLGEVHSGLLQHSAALPPAYCEQMLDRRDGERPRRFERPISHVVSADHLTGVDCKAATRTDSGAGPQYRIVGTVTTRSMITGGHVLQAASKAVVRRGARRHPWAHYLARRGGLEVLGKARAADLAAGFLQPEAGAGTLSLSGINGRTMEAVQDSGGFDRRPPLRAERTQLRWAAVLQPGAEDRMTMRVEGPRLRTLLFAVAPERLGAVEEFCADLALHDWLLSTLQHLVDVSRIGIGTAADVTGRLRPVVEHLLHLWMPAARSRETTAELWAALERRPGLTLQWRSLVDRVRDQLSINMLAMLTERPAGAR